MIRVGVAGLGIMGSWATRQFADHSGFEVRAVCDPATRRVTDAAERLGEVRCCSTVDDLIAAGDLDLVYVATPPALHRDAVLAAVGAGLHVVCEKPLALRAEDTEDMANAAAAAGVVNAVNFPLHYSGTIDAFRSWTAAGNLGRLRDIELDLAFPVWPRAWQDSAWVGTRAQGGPVREVCPHFFHLLLEVFGPVDAVWAANDYPADEARCEQAAVGMLRLRAGPLVVVRVMTGISAEERVRLVAYGDRGTIGLCDGHWPATGPAAADAFTVPELQPQPTPDPAPASLVDRLAHALEGRPADLCDFRGAVEVQRLLDAWTRAADRGGRIDLGWPTALASKGEGRFR